MKLLKPDPMEIKYFFFLYSLQ